jgi:hypothetical protein
MTEIHCTFRGCGAQDSEGQVGCEQRRRDLIEFGRRERHVGSGSGGLVERGLYCVHKVVHCSLLWRSKECV